MLRGYCLCSAVGADAVWGWIEHERIELPSFIGFELEYRESDELGAMHKRLTNWLPNRDAIYEAGAHLMFTRTQAFCEGEEHEEAIPRHRNRL